MGVGTVEKHSFCEHIYFRIIVCRGGARGGEDWREERRFHVPVITLKVIAVAVTFLL